MADGGMFWLARAGRCALILLPLFAAGSSALSQSSPSPQTQQQASDQGAALAPHEDDAVTALGAFTRSLASPHDANANQQDEHTTDNADSTERALRHYLREFDGDRPKLSSVALPPGHPSMSRAHGLGAVLEPVQTTEPGEAVITLAEAKATSKSAGKGETTTKTKAAKPAAKTSDDTEATFVGSQACMGCHATQAAIFAQTLMGRILRNPRTPQEKGGCETCHGAGSLHVKAGGGRGVGGIISFRKDDTSRTVEDNNAICLACHDKGSRVLWQGSAHESRDVACTNCHTIMTNVSARHQLKTEYEADTCFQCHKDKRAEIARSSHMPVREGKLTCTTCHNPHGSYGESLLKTATANDTCYKCHAEKRGPFLWEHAPVRENCMNCHNPHGSINSAMLKLSRPRLCQQCHTAADHPGNPGNPRAVYAIANACSNCHVKIHGSNSPAGSQFVR